ncbi:MAG: hypothetical protein KY451_01475 [Actinobacteria bacterium]|nr:hypothetical protein [Actinomycetota bacterium]
MPLRALLDGDPVVSVVMDDDAWTAAQAAVKADRTALLMPGGACCRAVPGRPGGGCGTSETSLTPRRRAPRTRRSRRSTWGRAGAVGYSGGGTVVL